MMGPLALRSEVGDAKDSVSPNWFSWAATSSSPSK